VLLWSLLPLLLAGGAVFGLGWFYWEARGGRRARLLEQWELSAALLAGSMPSAARPAVPLMAPMIVVALARAGDRGGHAAAGGLADDAGLVGPGGARRFPQLQRKRARRRPGRRALVAGLHRGGRCWRCC
jgi:hypothetical protein